MKKIIYSIILILLLPIALSFNIEFQILPVMDGDNINTIIEPIANNGTIFRGFQYLPFVPEKEQYQSVYGDTTEDEDLILSKNKTGIQIPKPLSKYLLSGVLFLFIVIILCGFLILIAKKKKKEEEEPIEKPKEDTIF